MADESSRLRKAQIIGLQLVCGYRIFWPLLEVHMRTCRTSDRSTTLPFAATWPGAITFAALAIGTQIAEYLLTGECLFHAGV